MQYPNPQNVVFCFFFLFIVSFSLQQEEELRKSGEAKYGHLSNDLHVLIEVFAPPGEAYSRMSSALDEIKKFLVPVSLIHYVCRARKFYYLSTAPVGFIYIMYFTPLFFAHC